MVAQTKISKKSFKELCSFHTYEGWNCGRIKHNVIYFDWKENEKGRGFKYAVAMNIKNGTKSELFNMFYNWVCNSVELPYYVRYRIAESDEKRFKASLSLNF